MGHGNGVHNGTSVYLFPMGGMNDQMRLIDTGNSAGMRGLS